MTYTAQKPPIAASSDELRARIPGWGADLDPNSRPSVPMLKFQETGAHWEFPERQPERWPRERSIEHKFLTPVFGTAQPPRGLPGEIRRYAYKKYSEGRAAHWLLLMAADRLDSLESSLASLLTLHPDNPITETGVLAEFSKNGAAARANSKRTDTRHQVLDPLIVGTPWLLRLGLGIVLIRLLARGVRVVR
ncbi:MAG TPA: hypothetical protein VKB75_16475 [Jatrophihabitans sp.]|nr:hypothetical protein [Jatrophihabitans sp.]